MKCNPWRWLWGLVPILMLGWIAILGERARIEDDLTSRTKTVLERSGFGWANIAFDGRDAVLTGRATDDGEPPKAIAAALDTMGVRAVENRTSLIDTAERYDWSAIRRDNRIRVDGLVPSDKTRRDVIGMVKATFPSFDIDDRMKLARGAPSLDIWLGGVSFGLKQLAQLREGRVDIEATSLSVSGDAADARSYRAVKTALSGQMPQGIRLKQDGVRPPVVSPFQWSARREGKEVLLVGHVPGDAVRDELMRAARKIGADSKVIDRMEPASGAPDGFSAAAVALIEQLGRLEEGTGKIRDKTAALTGIAETAARADDVKGAIGRAVLAAYRTTGDIGHREPVIKPIAPYETSFEVEGDAIVLKGYVPDEKARAALLAMARQRIGNRRIQDELQLGAGQPPGWEQCVEAGFEALQRLGGGRVGITGRRLLISGVAGTEPLAQSLAGEVRERVGAACDPDVRVTLDPASAQAREDARRQQELVEAQKRRQQEIERVRHQQQESARLEAERVRAAETQRLQDETDRRRREEEAARIRAAEEQRRVEEAARMSAEAARRRAEAERARAEAARPAVAPAEPKERQQVVDACQQAMSKVAREGVINFTRASFDLDPASFPTLNRLAEAANHCETVVIEIEGHTDSEGTIERNQLLSDRRANAVRNYLVRAGVDQGRLVAIGYGQSKNIAPNETAEGRAKNRRIEFLVKTR